MRSEHLPQAGGPLSRSFGRAVLRLLRFRVEGALPDVPKQVAVVAPHSSNWDFVVGYAAKLALGLQITWLGKSTLFRPPFGTLFRRMGGIPIDRTRAQRLVGTIAAEFDRRDRLLLAITPEGTRKPGARWHAGFYHIAREAHVPVAPVTLDWANRTLRFGPPQEATAAEPRAVKAEIERLRTLIEASGGRRRRR
ncbi:MAG: 1-acyl-sn-glycerol-3-phosphate acyltransferase [Deltaproteobacteria bacterium]|nr:1-acyl-sn-glycerol-3-phosphate acyltransferase [Deltaproteobacteria bacterium]